MGTEIERKFLVRGDDWREVCDEGEVLRQGYLATNDRCSVRVRIGGDRAVLTIKGAAPGLSRQEFEYPVPVADVERILDTLCQRPLIEKTRYRVAHAGNVWELDVFAGENEGLVVAELELEDEAQEFERPSWLGDEVSHEARYYNARLAEHPFSRW